MPSMKIEPLGPLENKVMDLLWNSPKPLKPQEVLCQLNQKYAYTTIMTILRRLADKKLANRKVEGRAYVYSPVMSKKLFVSKNLCVIYNNLVDTYGTVAISNFVDVVKNNTNDMLTLKDYLNKNQ